MALYYLLKGRSELFILYAHDCSKLFEVTTLLVWGPGRQCVEFKLDGLFVKLIT